MKNIVMIAVACCMLAGCETTTPAAGTDKKVAKQNGYAPTGTFIKRKDGEGLGPTMIGAASKLEAENARAMHSSGAGQRYGFR